ncbi:MAG: hypothetical protein M0006_09855 [Magnetospirillum sp.]|nr:hypothetical protein [Magnetospirillum sp.]
MTDTSASRDSLLLGLLARWQAFSLLQQRAFAFLAKEALASGQEFEDSTVGAAGVLMALGAGQPDGGTDAVQAEIWTVVQRLQAADRSRQGLEQVASVLTTLKRQHAELVAITSAAIEQPGIEGLIEDWIGDLAANVSLTDWRRRLDDALRGRDSAPPPPAGEDDELF